MGKCNHKCFECIYDDCILSQSEITIEERLAQDRRDRNYSTYGFVIPAKRRRKERGRRT